MRASFEKIAQLWNRFHGFGFVTRTRQLRRSYPGVLRIHVGFGGKTLILVGTFQTLEEIHQALDDVATGFTDMSPE
jgi:hypothetical protein